TPSPESPANRTTTDCESMLLPSSIEHSRYDATLGSSVVVLPSTRSRPAGIAPRRHVFGGIPKLLRRTVEEARACRLLGTAGRSRPRSKMSRYYSWLPEVSGN